uniref:TylF/MycF/NovP-related O-methyltransferase n=1 Tax=Altererythrobacter segetis TaxID=1104773 RepID=UPI00140A424D|nr:TylF/MycF/NovP-related O-methyltransferase [Altererythrobacter segetis]
MELGPASARDLARISETRETTPLLLTDARALFLLACVRAARPLGAAMAEAGVLWGGSARLICQEKGDCALHLYDVFETLQSGGLDDDGRTVRDHFDRFHSTLAAVERLLAPYEGVRFHTGLFPQSAIASGTERFAFVHLDLDLAAGTRAALEFFWPRLVPGGILLGDDYDLAEVRTAFDEHCASHGVSAVGLPWQQVMLVKT